MFDVILCVVVGIANMTQRAKLELFTLLDRQDGPTLQRLTPLTLNPGDVLVMRGDTIHAGAGYVREHFGRLHCYLDNDAVRRTLNSTDRDLPPLTSAALTKPKRGKRGARGAAKNSK